jgi:hypothetical protein
MSIQRAYTQRDNNSSKLVPEFVGILPNTDISGAAFYNLNLTNVNIAKGIYYVDMGDSDSTGNLLNLSGEFYPFVTGSSSTPISIVTFAVNIDVTASSYPGLEFTIFFKKLPINRLSGPPFLRLALCQFIKVVLLYHILFPHHSLLFLQKT